MTWIEKLILATIVALLALIVVGIERNAGEFSKACAAIGGITAHNGRHYECLKPERTPK